MKITDNGKHLDFGEWQVPEHTKGEIERYLLQGMPPGSFLTQVIEGDVHAVLNADMQNRVFFHDIVAFLYNAAPASSWGSPENMKSYMKEMREFLESQKNSENKKEDTENV